MTWAKVEALFGSNVTVKNCHVQWYSRSEMDQGFFLSLSIDQSLRDPQTREKNTVNLRRDLIDRIQLKNHLYLLSVMLLCIRLDSILVAENIVELRVFE